MLLPESSEVSDATLDVVFLRDGSYRDIVIRETSTSDWDLALDWLARQEASGALAVALVPEGIERSAGVLLRRSAEHVVRLEVRFGGVHLHAHLWEEDEIEFDVDPSNVESGEARRAVLAFMRGLALAVGRSAYLTGENVHSHPLLTFEVDAERWIVPVRPGDAIAGHDHGGVE